MRAVKFAVVLIIVSLIYLTTISQAQATVTPPIPEQSNLILYWKLDENTGVTAADSSGNGYSGTITNGTWVTGRYGYGVKLTEYGNITSDYSIDSGNGTPTISLWVDVQQDSGMIFEWEPLYLKLSGGELILDFYGYEYDLGPLQKGWHHIVVITDEDTDLNDRFFKVWVDNKVIATTKKPLEVSSWAAKVIIGHSSLGNSAISTVDDVRIWNVPLTDDEVKQMFEAIRIRIYDEINSTKISANVTVFSNTNQIQLIFDNITKDYIQFYANVSRYGVYFVKTSANDYYSRERIANLSCSNTACNLAELNVFLPPKSANVILEVFTVKDYTGKFPALNTTLTLKKFINGTLETISEKYIDFNSQTQAYLILSDYYQLYVSNGNEERNLGWFIPDPDGHMDVIIAQVSISNITNNWINYGLTADNSTGMISLTYSSSKNIEIAKFWVNFTNGSNAYYAEMTSNSGSFTYAGDVNNSYIVHFYAKASDGSEFEIIRYVGYNAGIQPIRFPLFPAGYPDWLYNLVAAGIIIIVVLLFSELRADIACVLGASTAALLWYWGWLKVQGIVIAVAMLIAGGAVIYYSRRRGA